MCGIVGAIDLNHNAQIRLENIQSMTGAIVHRGPDGDGFYLAGGTSPSHLAMGMRRLSIIDVAGGDQPIGNEDGSVQIVYNGEIYNYVELMPELREQGHQFKTACDTETVIHLYEEHGLDLFKYLRGMYTFALWDDRRQRLVLAVDHVGIKPLYTCQVGSLLLFASEAKALFAFSDDVPCEMNLDVLDIYMTVGFMVGQETLFKGVRRLAPGTALVIENGTIKEIRHWTPNYSPKGYDPDEIREVFEEAVRIHLRSDVPLGLFLSGGLDSASLLALMAKFEPGRIKTFSVGYTSEGQTEYSDNELEAARESARVFDSDHHELVLTAHDWWEHMQRYVYYHDEPNANPSAVSLLALSQLTAHSVKVVLNGIGSDELFGGYRHHRYLPKAMQQSATLRSMLPMPLRTAGRSLLTTLESLYPLFSRYRIIGAVPNLLPPIYHRLDNPPIHLRRTMTYDGQVFSDGMRRTLFSKQTPAAIDQAFSKLLALAPDKQPDNLIHFLVMYLWLPGNGLLSADKVSMAYSLEGRVPYFDRRLLELATSIPPEIRAKDNKYLLRSAMQTVLPEAIRTRPKKPFGTPIRSWFEQPLRTKLQEVLYDPVAQQRPYFEPRAYRRIIDDHFSGRTSQPEIMWRLVNLELWHRAFLDKRPTQDPAVAETHA